MTTFSGRIERQGQFYVDASCYFFSTAFIKKLFISNLFAQLHTEVELRDWL
jgi:hypothetical protein